MRFAAALAVALLALPPLQAQPKTFNSGGVRIAYIDHGEGDAVVFLHGFTGSAEDAVNDRVLAALKGYRVLAPDQRGHGKSDKPHDPSKYGREMVEDVVRLLDHAKVKEAHVIGYSMGAFVAGKLLVTHPDRLLSVTFGGGGPLCQPPPGHGATLAAAADSLAKGKGLAPLVLVLLPPGQPKPSPFELWMLDQKVLSTNDPKALAAVLRGEACWHVTAAELAANRVPVQFVHGDRETPALKDGVTRLTEMMCGAAVEVIEGRTHFDTLDTPEFRSAVVGFLRATAPSGFAPRARENSESGGRFAVPCPLGW